MGKISKKTAKKKRRKISVFPTPDEMFSMLHTIMEESERGCVLAVTGFVDYYLQLILRRKFKVESGISDERIDRLLIDGSLPPLGSFSVRIDLCRALGIFDDLTWKALDELREMRNDAAHLPEEFSLSDWGLSKMDAALTHDDRRLVEITMNGHDDELAAASGWTVHRVRFHMMSSLLIWRLFFIAKSPKKAKTILAKGVSASTIAIRHGILEMFQ
jgi:DNA-binding MltR family transcriptional regulator